MVFLPASQVKNSCGFSLYNPVKVWYIVYIAYIAYIA